MGLYRFLVQQISRYFEGCEFKHVPRLENGVADILSKLGSSRDAVPPEIALEHLRKPSIKPSRESDSIFIPPDPQQAAVPMDVDVGKGKTVAIDSGTVQSEPGISQPEVDGVVSADPTTVSSHGGVSVDVVMAISDFVDSISINPGTAPPDSGTDHSDPRTS